MTLSNASRCAVGALLVVILLATFAWAADYSVKLSTQGQSPQQQLLPKSPDEHSYNGFLRVFIVQDSSTHWWDYAGRPYRKANIGFAYNGPITVSYVDTVVLDVIWDASEHNFGDIQENNIRINAALTDNHGYQRDSNYPYNSDYPHAYYEAYPYQRMVTALPGETNTDPATGDFSHSILIEVATGSWCPYCPATANGLKNLYDGGAYPFEYVSLEDALDTNEAYLNDHFNAMFFPTGYVDGGYYLSVGGNPDTASWANLVRQAGELPVQDVFLEASLEWLGNAQLHIVVRVAKSGLTNQPPQAAATPDGTPEVYTDDEDFLWTSAVESEGDQVYYRWAFGDGDSSDWMGPYDSGDTCMVGHSWSTSGDYEVSAFVKDQFDAEAASWSDPFTVTVSEINYGDADGNGIVNISDAVFLIAYIFGGGDAPNPELAGDADCNGIVNISDAVFLIAYIFGGGDPPGCL
jgi:hypothetical protein